MAVTEGGEEKKVSKVSSARDRREKVRLTVCEVTEDDTGSLSDTHVGEEREQRGDSEGDVRESLLGGSGKDLGQVTVEGDTVQSSGRGVEIGGGGGPGGGDETGVDERGQSLDSGGLDGNHEGRGLGVVGGSELGVVGRDDDADDEGSHDVEEEDSEVDLLDRLWQVSSRVHGLSGGDGDNLGSDERERRLGEDRPESEELSERASDALVVLQGSGVLPEGESEVSSVRSGSAVDGDSDKDEGGDGQHLDHREPELGLSETARSEQVDDDDDDEADGDPDSVVDRRDPVVDEDGAGGQLGGENDEPVAERGGEERERATR